MGYDASKVYETQSDWLKASDLNRQEHQVVIEGVALQEINDNGRTVRKLELSFANREKRLLLNKTNSDAISYAYTPDTDAWIGKALFIYPTMVDFQGRQVEAIRVRPALAQASQHPQQPPPAPQDEPPYAPPPPDAGPDSLDDDIPF